MKRLLFMFAAMFAVALGSTSCETSGDEASDYVPPTPSEDASAYTPEIVEIKPGNERAEIVWALNNEEGTTITHCYIYGETEVYEVALDNSNQESYSYEIELEEGDHTFYVKTLDSNGSLSSASATSTVSVYGEVLATQLNGRRVISSTFTDIYNTCVLTFHSNVESTVEEVRVTYETTQDEFTTVTCGEADSMSVTLQIVKDGSIMTIETDHLPYENALDIVTVSSSLNISSTSTYFVVSSLESLWPYLEDGNSNVNVKLSAGTYSLDDANFYMFGYNVIEVDEGQTIASLMTIAGDNNYYDFTNVTIEIATELYIEYEADNEEGFRPVYAMHFTGENNTVVGLNLVDSGSDVPVYGCANVVMDGSNNLLSGVSVYGAGSDPYAYGELFGNGSSTTVMDYTKHTSCILRGDNNTMQNCNVIQRTYGDFIAVEAATNATISGCYLEGEMSTTDAVLMEEGTDGPADLVYLMTTWGYEVPAGYTFSLAETGVCVYELGTTVSIGVDGDYVYTTSRSTTNVTVQNTTIVGANDAIDLTKATGTKSVDGCTIIGCQGGIIVGSDGTVMNTSVAAPFGPAITTSTEDSGVTAKITIDEYTGEAYSGNGSKQLAVIFGDNQNIEFYKGTDLTVDEDVVITLGGDSRELSELADVDNNDLTNSTIVNETGYTIEIDLNSASSGNTIVTNGKVVDTDGNEITGSTGGYTISFN